MSFHLTDDQIEAHVKFRMGKWYSTPIKKYNPNPTPYDITWVVRTIPNKDVMACNDISINPQEQRMDGFSQLLDEWNIKTLHCIVNMCDNRWYTDELCRITHNRNVNQDNNILLPLREQVSQMKKFHGRDPYTWSDKWNELIWRGKPTGSFLNHRQEMISFAVVCKRMTMTIGASWRNAVGEYSHESALLKFGRYRFVKKWGDLFNIGFHRYHETGNSVVDKIFDGLVKKRMHSRKMFEYKYQLVLDGNDWPSALYKTLRSDSVVLMPPPNWHGIYHVGLEEWKHYVPIKRDASDLGDVVEWCKNNDDECREISNNATEYMEQFTFENEKRIWERLFEKYEENLENK